MIYLNSRSNNPLMLKLKLISKPPHLSSTYEPISISPYHTQCQWHSCMYAYAYPPPPPGWPGLTVNQSINQTINQSINQSIIYLAYCGIQLTKKTHHKHIQLQTHTDTHSHKAQGHKASRERGVTGP